MKILIKLPNWIGDAVMASSMIENIKEKLENPQITIVGKKHILDLYDIDEYITRKEIDNTKIKKGRLKATKQFAEKVGKHDLAFILTNNFISAMFAFYTKTPIRIGYKKEFRSILLTHALKENKKIHYVKQYDNLLNTYLNEDLPNRSLFLNKKIENISNDYILIAPGAAFGDAKQWKIDGFVYLINKLKDRYNIKIIGSSLEKELVSKIECKIFDKTNIDNLVEKTNITELTNLIANAKLIISNDSGPMHIAAAFQKKTVAIYGPTNELYSHPWMNKNAYIIKNNIDCRPCGRKKCPIYNNNCMSQINEVDVLKKIESIL